MSGLHRTMTMRRAYNAARSTVAQEEESGSFMYACARVRLLVCPEKPQLSECSVKMQLVPK